MGTFALTLHALLFAAIIAFSSFSITQIVDDTALPNNNGYKAYGSLSDFNFAAAGDWGCNSNSVNTVNNIVNKNPELVLALGDFSYQDTADCWLEIIAPLEDKMEITIGNHEAGDVSLLNQYMSHFNLTKQFYSFNYQNVHFTVISTEILNDSEKDEQYEFVNADLASAASDPNIDWIVVYHHREAYTSPYTDRDGKVDRTAHIDWKEEYHPLFERYDVDLVLQAHNHNYERSYPIKYNAANSSAPMITDSYQTINYFDPEGQIFVTVGTGGAESYFFLTKEPYMVRQYNGYGFLNVDVIDNGQTFNATFYSNDGGGIKDQFSITKNGSTTAADPNT